MVDTLKSAHKDLKSLKSILHTNKNSLSGKSYITALLLYEKSGSCCRRRHKYAVLMRYLLVLLHILMTELPRLRLHKASNWKLIKTISIII